MFERPHHQAIAAVLRAVDADLIAEANCYFGGGTAITLLLGEYRQSWDIDFLCADLAGYRLLRNRIVDDIAPFVRPPIEQVGSLRKDQYGIRTRVRFGAAVIKLEIIFEARIPLQGGWEPALGVATLDRVSLYASKLLANADRGLDAGALSRDLIDLAMMVGTWGPIPPEAWELADHAYGDHVKKAYHAALRKLDDPAYFAHCCDQLSIAPAHREGLLDCLAAEAP